MVAEPTSEAPPKEVVQPPAEDTTTVVTAETAEAPSAEVQEKDVLAGLTDDEILSHPRLTELQQKELKRLERQQQEEIDKAVGKEKRRIANQERQRAQAAFEKQQAQIREQVLEQIANEDDPDKRQQLRAQLGVQKEIDQARQDAIQAAMSQWGAEGLLNLRESGLLPSDPEEAAEFKSRLYAKYGENPDGSARQPTYFEQVNELVAHLKEQYVPKSEVDKLATQKAKALRESAAAEEAEGEKPPVELSPLGKPTVRDYKDACDLYNAGTIDDAKFREYRKQFGVE